MTRDEIVTALRCCAGDSCEGCPYDEIFAVEDAKCIEKAMGYAADLIENQQRHIEALMKANAGLRDTVLRRDAQIADMSDGLAQFAKAVAEKELAGGCLLLLAHDARLFVVLAFLHFRKNAGLFHLLLETAKRDVEAVVVIVKIYSGQNNHLPLRQIRSSRLNSRAAKKNSGNMKKGKNFIA